MARKKRIPKEFEPALSLAGLSIGSSILGGALQPHVPAGVTNPLTATGRVAGRFVSPLAVMGVAGFTFKKIKKLEKKIKKRR